MTRPMVEPVPRPIHAHRAGRLVAEMAGEGTRAMPIAKLESAHNPDNRSGKARTLYIHNDHRGSPQAMTDANQRVVWRASQTPWGGPEMHKAGDKAADQPGTEEQSAVLNLRLPGQYFDAETGLHDNWHRTYNPATGRYLQPDPLGYQDGPNPYLYAGGDPVNKIDPTGLYQRDMHYYMVFFLALTAGMDYTNARITALASQYVDDNPLTRPLDDENILTTGLSIFINHKQLLFYHFVLSDSSNPELASFGKTLTKYDNNDVNSVYGSSGNYSPQLSNLIGYSNDAKNSCAKYQFLGEFLHAYLDTFSHRDNTNIPYDAYKLLMGVGHGLSGSSPDYTYNDAERDDPYINARLWLVREDRTLAGEKAIFDMLKEKYRDGPSVDFDTIKSTLETFNKLDVDESDVKGDNDSINQDSKKISVLQIKLNELINSGAIQLKDANGNTLTSLNLFESDGGGYNKKLAGENRNNFLGNLDEKEYAGTCLPGGKRCKPVKF